MGQVYYTAVQALDAYFKSGQPEPYRYINPLA